MTGASRVWMRHPDLPADQVIEVSAAAAAHHRAAGWVQTTKPAPPLPAGDEPAADVDAEPAAPEPDAPADAGASPSAPTPESEQPTEQPKRRRAPKESDQ